MDYFDTETAEMKNTEMYVEGFKAKLVKDTSYRGLWTEVYKRQVLERSLNGYKEYKKKVKYRLIPFVW